MLKYRQCCLYFKIALLIFINDLQGVYLEVHCVLHLPLAASIPKSLL